MDKGFEQTFLPNDTQMANKHMRRCSISLIITETQNQNHHEISPVSIRMFIPKKKKTQALGDDVQTGTPGHCWWNIKWRPLWKQHGSSSKD